MKKIFAGLIAVLMMAAGLVTFSASVATAASAPTAASAATAPSAARAIRCPYTGCIRTSTRISAPNRVFRHRSARICVRVGTAGNGRPRGRVTVSLVRANGGFRWSNSRATSGRYRVCFGTPRLHRLGRYVVRARFDGRSSSAYRASRDRDTLRVVRRGR
jgi:hypothetical protein